MADENYYSFTSHLRKGFSNAISGIADLSEKKADATILMRASVNAQLQLKTDSVTAALDAKTLYLYGPGDVTGIDQRAIIRTDPARHVSNFEPNYLAAIEFYEEDLPWRFSPALQNTSVGTTAANARLTPWIALVVLEKTEFTIIPVNADSATIPLASFRLSDTADASKIFCAPENLWAFAHVHTNKDIVGTAKMNGTVSSTTMQTQLKTVMDETGDYCYSRLLCPRRMTAKTAYTAFLVPAFETGRLSGLGKYDEALLAPVNASAWKNNNREFPFYYSWDFATGSAGDFEYLARQLKPEAVDEKVGFREIYADGILNGTARKALYMPGALQVPFDTLSATSKQTRNGYENWEAPQNPHSWQKEMAAKLNVQLDSDQEPVITMPIYGQWHAQAEEILYKKSTQTLLPVAIRNNWVHELNLDPRYRAAAALGTKVIQQHQEELMDAAWQQLDDLKIANERIKRMQLAIEVNHVLIKNCLNRFQQEQLLGYSAILTKQIKMKSGKTIFNDVSKSALPNAVVSNLFKKITRNTWRIKNVGGNSKQVWSGNLLDRINQQKIVLGGLGLKAGGLYLSTTFDAGLQNVLSGQSGFKTLPLASKTTLKQTLDKALTLNPAFATSLKNLPSGFAMQKTSTVFFAATMQPMNLTVANTLSVLKAGISNRNTFVGLKTEFTIAAPLSVSISEALTTLKQNMKALPWLKGKLDRRFPQRKNLWSGSSDQVYPVMDYPEFDLPMYLPLAEISHENFVPNLNLIPQNSVTLLETNQRFIEAYLLGINHEFSRELLWRGYPTDQRGTYFRHFWDSLTGEKDIEEIHTWRKTLGNNGMATNQGMLVLVVRGDLLKKYPNTVIYAQKAAWNGSVTKDRMLDGTTEAIFPTFEAKLDPDIYMLGFKLNESLLIGAENPTSTTADPGYFFVFQERPGEPRFGLDAQRSSTFKKWSDLSWDRTETTEGTIMSFKKTLTFTKALNDIQASWPPKDAAQLAYILYQQPVMVAIHASRLLGK